MTNENDQPGRDDSSQIQVFRAFMSFILPGLGQLAQGRLKAGLGFFLLFALTGALPVLGCFSLYTSPPTEERDAVNFLLILMVPALLAVLFAALDAAGGIKGKPSPVKKPAFILAGLYILGILITSLLLPAVSRATECSRRMQCQNNLKNIGLALLVYRDVYGSFPPVKTVDKEGKTLHSWRVLLLPYLENVNLYEKIRLNEPWDSEYNRQFHSKNVYTYSCPSWRIGRNRQPQDARCYTNYSVVVGEHTLFSEQEPVKSDLSDGASNTVLLVERLLPVCWMDPDHEITYDEAAKGINQAIKGVGSAHAGGCNICFADAGFRFVSEEIEPDVWQKILRRSP